MSVQLSTNLFIFLHDYSHSEYIYNIYILYNPDGLYSNNSSLHSCDSVSFLLSICTDILFHLDGLTTPNQVWNQLESLFGVQDDLRAHQLEIELFSLIPRNFDSLEGLFTKLKSLVLIIKKCGIEK